MQDSPTNESMLQKLFSDLFIGKTVEFFDAEPDDEFINVVDGSGTCSFAERSKALEDFRKSLKLEEEFTGDYGKLNEVFIQSEDFVDSLKIPFLSFSLSTCVDDSLDPAAAFRIDFFEVFCIGTDRFVVKLYVRNTIFNHMEVHLRFTNHGASRVVRAILRAFEDLAGCDGHGNVAHCASEYELEEILARNIQIGKPLTLAFDPLGLQKRGFM